MYRILILLILIDQITKVIFTARDFFIPYLFSGSGIVFRLVKNYGLPFGVDISPLMNLLVVTAALSAFILFTLKNFSGDSRAKYFGTALVLAGAISNILDRIVFGFVRDWLDLGFGFAFNLADAMILVGLMFILFSPANFLKSGKVSR
jgi:signal peptidase II